MNEISTGLDSAAAYDIIKAQRSAAQKLRKTCVMTLLQPSPEIFGLFDYVMLLNDGHVMYHGPRDQALPYFEVLGFVCPPGRDAADFLMDLGTNQQARYEKSRFGEIRHPRRPAEFAKLFEQSVVHAKMLEDLHSPHDPYLLHDMEVHFDKIPEFHQTFWQNVWTLMKREAKVTLRNEALVKGRAVMTAVVGLLLSTLFYRFNETKVQVVLGIKFASILFIALSQASQLAPFMTSRGIFYKQRGSNFYRTSAYVVSVSVSMIPLALFETIIFGSLVYWLCGFVSDFGAFLVFELILFLANLAFAAWFLFLSAITPNLHITEPLSMLLILFYILFAGFLITKENIQDYFIWAYWLNPMSWCFRSLAINQFRSDEFNVCEKGCMDYCATFGKQAGEYSLSVFQIQAEKAWLWWGVAFMVMSYVSFLAISGVILEYIRYESPEHVFVKSPDNEVNELANASSDDTEEYYLSQTPRDVNVYNDGFYDLPASHWDPHH